MTNPETTPEINLCNDFKYPSYKFIYEQLMKFDMKIGAEYGEYNHEYLKIIWGNINDETIIKTCGENINHREGFTALQANYYAFLHVMRLVIKDDRSKYRDSFIDIKHTISRSWDGIGTWVH